MEDKPLGPSEEDKPLKEDRVVSRYKDFLRQERDLQAMRIEGNDQWMPLGPDGGY